jgi:hypothetical protein
VVHTTLNTVACGADHLVVTLPGRNPKVESISKIP